MVVVRDLKIQYCCIFLLFRVMEIHRIDEVTATPYMVGANLSEFYESNNKRI